MRVTIIGPGSVGLLMACRFTQAGQDVTLLDYKPERAERLNAGGITLSTPQGDEHFSLPVTCDPAALTGCDLAMDCVKAYSNQSVAPELGEYLGKESRVLTLQNGAGNLERLIEAVGAERAMGGITSEGANMAAEGHVIHAGQGQTHLGRAAGAPDDFLLKLVEVFQSAGFNTSPAEKVQDLIWFKLVINVGINPLTALLDVPNGMLLEIEGAHETMKLAVAEAVAVGKALGVTFLREDMLAAVEEVAKNTAKNVSSMLADIRNQRRTEVDFINGAVCRAGEKAGLATPVNQTLTHLVKAKEGTYI